MSVQTECRTWKLVFESYVEVQPDFATAKIQHENPETPIFWLPNIAPRKFSTPPNEHSALYLRVFLRILSRSYPVRRIVDCGPWCWNCDRIPTCSDPVRISSELVEISSELVWISSELVSRISELLIISAFIKTKSRFYTRSFHLEMKTKVNFYFLRLFAYLLNSSHAQSAAKCFPIQAL